MSIGVVGIQTGQKNEQSGPPFALTSANNGLSVDSVSGKVVLGNDVGALGQPAVLLSNREIPLNGFNVGLKGPGFFGMGTATPRSVSHTDGSYNTVIANSAISGGFNISLVNYDFKGLPGGGGSDMNILTAGIQSNNYSSLELSRTRGTLTVPLAVQNGDSLGRVLSYGYDGTGMRNRAGIDFIVDGVVAANTIPTKMVFYAGTNTLAERMRITSAGNVSIGNIAPTARLHLPAGTATASTSPLKFTAGVNLTVPEAGSLEWDGTNLFFTNVATRENVFIGNSGAAAPGTTPGVVITNFYGTSATNFLGDPNSWASVVLGGTTYKIPLYT